MKWTTDFTDAKANEFTIKPMGFTNKATGETWNEYCLWVYKDGKDTHDYLQDTLIRAKEFALSQFGVPLDSWTEDQNPE